MKDSQNPRWFQKLIYPSFFLAVTYLNIPELFYKYRRRRWQKSHSWISKFLYFLIFISLSEIDLSFQMASSAMNQASTTENNSKNLASAAGKEDKARGRKRQTSKGKSATNLKEKKMKLSVAEGEIDALHLTKIGSDEQPPCRKLVDFIFHDSEGKPQPFEMSEINDIFITSTIMPMDDDMIEEKGRGVKCVGFGRIESWSISGYDEGTPIIWISTCSADYEVVKPTASYKKLYVRFWEKARVCVEVFKATSRPNGGNPDISVEELLGKVARSMSGTKTLPAGSSAIDFLLSLGDFIYNQLIGLDESDAIFASMPALISLRDRCQQSRVQINRGSIASSSGRSLKIEEGNTSEDGKLARLLQEEKNWKSLKQHNSRRNRSSRSKFYIKINEKELANDYPLPTYFKPVVQEMDEYIFYDNHNSDYYTDGLPKRVLNNWSLYNSDSRLISLELLPMKPCAETDVTIFGSGSMTEDDGSGFCFDLDQAQSSTSTSDEPVDTGIPIYLSSIKEWMIEFGCSIIFVSIRTDMAWYRLGKPSKQYSSWYEPILKTGKLAVDIISLLKEQTRVSRLSFWDVIKRVSEFDKNRPSYISSDVVSVEKYLMVHAQIILQLFAEFPDPLIKKSSFAALLSEKMEKRNHTKLEMKKKASPAKEINNMNPSASSSMIPTVQSNRKAMRATTTKFINNLWREYYSGELSIGDLKIDQVLDDVVEEDEEDEVDDDVDVQIQASDNIQIPHSPNKPGHSQSENKEINWEGASSGTMSSSGWALYRCAMVRGCKINVGGTVSVVATEAGGSVLILVEYMFETPNGGKMIHGRVLKKGSLTILGNTANKTEVFLTNECKEYELSQVKESVVVEIRKILWGHQFRKKNADADKIYKKKAEDREKKGFPTEYFCKSLYSPERGAFFALSPDTIGLGSGVCHSCTVRETDGDGDFTVNVSEAKFIYKKVQYKVDDFVYVNASHFGNIREDSGTHKAGRNKGLKAYVVCHLLDIVYENSKQPDLDNTKVRVRRFYRPEDISAERGYCSDIREVLYTDEMLNIPIQAIQGKCQVRKKIHLPMLDTPVNLEHIFFCDRFYDPQTGSMKQLPPTNSLLFSRPSKDDDLYNKAKGKKKWDEREEEEDSHLKWKGVPKEDRLSTLDIFAGCGGLSEGLQKSGVSYTKWAIEYDQPAGMAFRHNNPHALVYIDNCNIILRAVMEKCGDADDSVSPSEAVELVAKLDKEKIDNLPLPGEVDFINGGPPCQGFSGMNRFSQSTWSKVQCEMILAFLSFADYFRPRFFLLENVRTFVSFNKGQTFHLTIASLLEMGYQVRFGILEAGTFGVSQSRKRAFIWAASPEEILPEWPEPMHVFAGPDLKVSLPGGLQYSAARSTASGAPFRSITVRDTIGDLPPVGNGASNFEIEYGSEPVSSFQKKIRGNMTVLSDHISKEMNELNLIRCKHIPCKPGADWRDLPEKKVKLSTGLMVDLIPWCLPNTAKRHNQWKGLFGRLDWEGNFPTSITDPQPMGKVGMCFHPDQDRILTVREFARSQGFMDNFHFSGNIQNKYRQIGNAVPPPLAYALGTKLKEAVDAKK